MKFHILSFVVYLIDNQILGQDICQNTEEEATATTDRNTIIRLSDDVPNNVEYKWDVGYDKSRCQAKKQKQRCNLMAWEATRNLQKFLATYKVDPDNPDVVIDNSMVVPGMKFTLKLTVMSNGKNIRTSQFIVSENKTTANSQVSQGTRRTKTLGKVDIVGPNQSYADIDLYLIANVVVCVGDIDDVKMQWEILTDTGQLFSNLSYTGMQLMVPSQTFTGGTKYRVRATATLNLTTVETFHNLDVGKRGLDVRLNAKALTVGIDEPIRIIASISNPDNTDNDFDLDWSCKYENQDCENFEGNTAILDLQNGFPKPGRYDVTVKVEEGDDIKTDTVIINVLDRESRSIEVDEIQSLVDLSKPVEISAKITKLVKGCLVEWESLQEDGYSVIDLTAMPGYPGIINVTAREDTFLDELVEPENESSDRDFILTILPKAGNWPGLEGDKSYLIRLQVSCPNDPQSVFADIPLTTNASPRLQSLQVNPTSGMALTTKFAFTTQRALDVPNDYPLLYKYGYELMNKSLYFIVGNDLYSAETILPYSGSGIKAILNCCDNRGSCTLTEGPIVDVKIPNQLSEEDESQLRKHFTVLLSRGDYMQAINYAISLLETYNWFSNDMLKEDMEQFIIENIDQQIVKMINSVSISDSPRQSANELIKSVISLADFVKLPEDLLANVIELRMKISDLIRRERIMTEAENISHLLALINSYTKRSVGSFGVNEVKDYLETLELVIMHSDIPSTVEKQKSNVVSVLDRYLGRLCSLLYDGQRIKIDLQTISIVLEQLSNNHFTSFVDVPYPSNPFKTSIKIKFINEWKKYTTDSQLCVAKGILSNYFDRKGYTYMVDIYDGNSYGRFQPGAEFGNYVIFDGTGDPMQTCTVFDHTNWNRCKKMKQNEDTVLCKCNKFGYYGTEFQNYEEITTIQTTIAQFPPTKATAYEGGESTPGPQITVELPALTQLTTNDEVGDPAVLTTTAKIVQPHEITNSTNNSSDEATGRNLDGDLDTPTIGDEVTNSPLAIDRTTQNPGNGNSATASSNNIGNNPSTNTPQLIPSSPNNSTFTSENNSFVTNAIPEIITSPTTIMNFTLNQPTGIIASENPVPTDTLPINWSTPENPDPVSINNSYSNNPTGNSMPTDYITVTGSQREIPPVSIRDPATIPPTNTLPTGTIFTNRTETLTSSANHPTTVPISNIPSENPTIPVTSWHETPTNSIPVITNSPPVTVSVSNIPSINPTNVDPDTSTITGEENGSSLPPQNVSTYPTISASSPPANKFTIPPSNPTKADADSNSFITNTDVDVQTTNTPMNTVTSRLSNVPAASDSNTFSPTSTSSAFIISTNPINFASYTDHSMTNTNTKATIENGQTTPQNAPTDQISEAVSSNITTSSDTVTTIKDPSVNPTRFDDSSISTVTLGTTVDGQDTSSITLPAGITGNTEDVSMNSFTASILPSHTLQTNSASGALSSSPAFIKTASDFTSPATSRNPTNLVPNTTNTARTNSKLITSDAHVTNPPSNVTIEILPPQNSVTDPASTPFASTTTGILPPQYSPSTPFASSDPDTNSDITNINSPLSQETTSTMNNMSTTGILPPQNSASTPFASSDPDTNSNITNINSPLSQETTTTMNNMPTNITTVTLPPQNSASTPLASPDPDTNSDIANINSPLSQETTSTMNNMSTTGILPQQNSASTPFASSDPDTNSDITNINSPLSQETTTTINNTPENIATGILPPQNSAATPFASSGLDTNSDITNINVSLSEETTTTMNNMPENTATAIFPSQNSASTPFASSNPDTNSDITNINSPLSQEATTTMNNVPENITTGILPPQISASTPFVSSDPDTNSDITNINSPLSQETTTTMNNMPTNITTVILPPQNSASTPLASPDPDTNSDITNINSRLSQETTTTINNTLENIATGILPPQNSAATPFASSGPDTNSDITNINVSLSEETTTTMNNMPENTTTAIFPSQNSASTPFASSNPDTNSDITNINSPLSQEATTTMNNVPENITTGILPPQISASTPFVSSDPDTNSDITNINSPLSQETTTTMNNMPTNITTVTLPPQNSASTPLASPDPDTNSDITNINSPLSQETTTTIKNTPENIATGILPPQNSAATPFASSGPDTNSDITNINVSLSEETTTTMNNMPENTTTAIFPSQNSASTPFASSNPDTNSDITNINSPLSQEATTTMNNVPENITTGILPPQISASTPFASSDPDTNSDITNINVSLSEETTTTMDIPNNEITERKPPASSASSPSVTTVSINSNLSTNPISFDQGSENSVTENNSLGITGDGNNTRSTIIADEESITIHTAQGMGVDGQNVSTIIDIPPGTTADEEEIPTNAFTNSATGSSLLPLYPSSNVPSSSPAFSAMILDFTTKFPVSGANPTNVELDNNNTITDTNTSVIIGDGQETPTSSMLNNTTHANPASNASLSSPAIIPSATTASITNSASFDQDSKNIITKSNSLGASTINEQESTSSDTLDASLTITMLPSAPSKEGETPILTFTNTGSGSSLPPSSSTMNGLGSDTATPISALPGMAGDESNISSPLSTPDLVGISTTSAFSGLDRSQMFPTAITTDSPAIITVDAFPGENNVTMNISTDIPPDRTIENSGMSGVTIATEHLSSTISTSVESTIKSISDSTIANSDNTENPGMLDDTIATEHPLSTIGTSVEVNNSTIRSISNSTISNSETSSMSNVTIATELPSSTIGTSVEVNGSTIIANSENNATPNIRETGTVSNDLTASDSVVTSSASVGGVPTDTGNKSNNPDLTTNADGFSTSGDVTSLNTNPDVRPTISNSSTITFGASDNSAVPRESSTGFENQASSSTSAASSTSNNDNSITRSPTSLSQASSNNNDAGDINLTRDSASSDARNYTVPTTPSSNIRTNSSNSTVTEPEKLSQSENTGRNNQSSAPIQRASILSAPPMSKSDEISLIVIGVSILGIILLGIVGAVMNRVKRERTIETTDNVEFPRYANVFHQDTLEGTPQ